MSVKTVPYEPPGQLFFNLRQRSSSMGVSLSTTFGAALILLLGIILVTCFSLERSRSTMLAFLSEKGFAVISALESGIRSGMRSSAGMSFQYLVEDLAERREVRFIAVTMPDGTILVHSNPRRIGEKLFSASGEEIAQKDLDALHPDANPAWKIMEMEGDFCFVVYKIFYPQKHAHHEPVSFSSTATPWLFLGLDLEPLRVAQLHDRKRALLIAGSILMAGLLALLGLHTLDRFRIFRKRQHMAEAFAEEMAVTLPDGLILLDVRGKVLQLNKAARKLLGMDSASSAQKADARNEASQKLQKTLPPSLAALAERLLHGTVLPETEITIQNGGHILHLSVRGGQVMDVEKERLGSLIFLRDMTEIRFLEAEVRRKEKLAAVGNLAAGVAHELRNPLSSIKGYATYFAGRFPEGSADREAARVMVQEADRLNRVISDLIGLSRPSDIQPKPTDMRRLIHDTLRLLNQDTIAHSVHVHLNLAEDVPIWLVDPDRMRQVLLNLCLNAVQAMPEGGDLYLSLTADAGTLFCEIRDTGSGIPAEILPHIFDPYFTTKNNGTGLGLATVHKIIEAHGGTISVSSEQGHGTTCRLRIPLGQI